MATGMCGGNEDDVENGDNSQHEVNKILAQNDLKGGEDRANGNSKEVNH